MTDTEKPFACPSPGCNMSFVNEDHLVVHKKKHDMILNFGTGGKSSSFIDQTPTPTRFIRNCEEVGLFQDLQNVNPFEETFRRAVEGKIGSLSESEIIINDDTLHTPHVFPHIEDNSSNKIVLHRADDTDTEIDETLESKSKDVDLEKPNCESLEVVICKEVTKTSETIVIQEADTSIIQQSPQLPSSTSLSINGEEVQFLLKTQDGKFMQLSATPMIDSSIPAVNIQSQPPSTPQTIVIETALPFKSNEVDKSVEKSPSPTLLDAKQRLRDALIKIKKGNVTSSEVIKNDKVQNKTTEKKSLIMKKVEDKNINNVDLRRKQDVQARNRASSMRARAKRKQWINQLQHSLDEANKVNSKLQVEIRNLRLEVSNLKTVLLAHKDCSVTKEMAKNNKIFVDPKVISLSSLKLPEKTALLSTDPTPGIKRESVSQDVPNARNKKVKTPKQSIILPKTDDKIVPIVAKVISNPCNNIKLVNFSQVVDEKSNKPILIVQNGSQKNVQIINSRQVVQVDQSLQLINVASKTTGT